MDSLCFKAGVHGLPPQISFAGGGLDVRANPSNVAAAMGRSTAAANAMPVDKPSVSVAAPPRRTSSWGFSFTYPLRSLWPGGGKRYDAIALDDAVLVEEKEQDKGEAVGVEGEALERQNRNWVLKILRINSASSEEGKVGAEERTEIEVKNSVADDQREECCSGNDIDCEGCRADNDEGDKIQFDRDSFSKLLRRVSLADAKMYAKMSYLGIMAYSISQIKPENLLKFHGLRFVTSSLEKKELAMKAEKEKLSAEVQGAGETSNETEGDKAQEKEGSQISAYTAYQIAASAASYLHSHTKGILSFKSSKSEKREDLPEGSGQVNDNLSIMDSDVASFMATTNSVTAVVAAKEEVKQAVADDLNSTTSSPCEWYICDDDLSRTRFFVIQGSESLASWKANLLFEPIEFEGLDILVHRGIYEAAKGMYEQMLPEVQAHLKAWGDRATFRFTGHSLGGSLAMLINLMLFIRGQAPPSSLLPVITFGAPSIMCGGDQLLSKLGLPRRHVQSVTMHRDIVPRAFSCKYPDQVAKILKAVNGSFRNHPCLNNQSVLYTPMGEFLILQPDEKSSPSHDLLPAGSGLYLLNCPELLDVKEAEKQLRAAQDVFLNSPHPLETLSDRSAYGSGGAIQRDHDMDSYMKSVHYVVRQELKQIRKATQERRRRVWWPLVLPDITKASVIVGRPGTPNMMGQSQFNFSGIVQSGRESLRRFCRLVASQHTHLLVVLLFPARMLILGAYSFMK